MPMTFTSMLAPKGTSGSIANWAGYSKLDLPVILEEAQYLIYEMLRVREMRTEWTFGVKVGYSGVALPDRYLDPLGPLYDVTNGRKILQTPQNDLQNLRSYEAVSGAFGTDPFSTSAGNPWVVVHKVGHDLTQSSTITISGSTPVDVIDINSTYQIEPIDADNFTLFRAGEPLAVTSVTGGGSSATYTGNRLVNGMPSTWSILGTGFWFDIAHTDPCVYKHNYYRRPQLLSASNPNNFLTDRYPTLLRVATQAAAAEFMEDDGKYQKHVAKLGALISSTIITDDLSLRGASFGTDTP